MGTELSAENFAVRNQTWTLEICTTFAFGARRRTECDTARIFLLPAFTAGIWDENNLINHPVKSRHLLENNNDLLHRDFNIVVNDKNSGEVFYNSLRFLGTWVQTLGNPTWLDRCTNIFEMFTFANAFLSSYQYFLRFLEKKIQNIF